MLKLTKREEQAASYLKLGCTDAEIAEKIHCSQRTAKNYVALIKKKLKANKEDFYSDEWRVECFQTVLKYILPEGESHEFIAGQRQKHLKQSVLFD